MKQSRTLISILAGTTALFGLSALAVTSASAQDGAQSTTQGQINPLTQQEKFHSGPISITQAPQQNIIREPNILPQAAQQPQQRMQTMPQMMMGGHVDQMVIDGRSIYVAYDGMVVKLNKDTLKVEAQVQLPPSGMRPMGGMPPQPQRGGLGGGSRIGSGGGFGGGNYNFSGTSSSGTSSSGVSSGGGTDQPGK